MPRVKGQRKTNKQIATEYAAAKRKRVKKRPALSVYGTTEEAEWRAGVEARRTKAAERKAAHQEGLAQISEEARAAYDAKALRKHEGRQRLLDEYRTLD